jgi:hypothetical protein
MVLKCHKKDWETEALGVVIFSQLKLKQEIEKLTQLCKPDASCINRTARKSSLPSPTADIYTDYYTHYRCASRMGYRWLFGRDIAS